MIAISEIAAATHDQERFTRLNKIFIDDLIHLAQETSFHVEGPLAVPPEIFSEPKTVIADPVMKAYVHGLCEHLCDLSHRIYPAWTSNRSSYLEMPYYFGPANNSSRYDYLRTTPGPFRTRLLFTGPVFKKFWDIYRKTPVA